MTLRVTFSLFVVCCICLGDARSATILVDTGNNPGTDGTALFALGEAVNPGTTEIFNPLPESSSTSSPIVLSQLMTIDFSGTRYVQFAFDLNEPGNNSGDDWSVSQFELSVAATPVYSLAAADTVIFNPTGVVDANNGGDDIDGSVLVPESLFQGQGFELTDTFTITATFGDLAAGADRLIIGPGDGTQLSVNPEIPEPSVPGLFVLAVYPFLPGRRRPRES